MRVFISRDRGYIASTNKLNVPVLTKLSTVIAHQQRELLDSASYDTEYAVDFDGVKQEMGEL